MTMTKAKRGKRVNLKNLSHVPHQAKSISFNAFHERMEYKGTIASISQNGLYIKTDQILQKGSKVFLTFPINNRKVKCLGKVTYINRSDKGSQSPGFGVRFTQMMDLDFHTIRRALISSFAHKK